MYALGIVVVELQGNGFKQLAFVCELVEDTQLSFEVVVERFLKAVLPWGSRDTGAHSNLQADANRSVVLAQVLAPSVIVQDSWARMPAHAVHERGGDEARVMTGAE